MKGRPEPLRAAGTEAEALLNAARARAAARGLLPSGAALTGELSLLRDSALGDLAASHALRSAAALGKEPGVLAELLAAHAELGESCFSALEAAGPGFLNFHLAESWVRETPERIAESCGRAEPLFVPGSDEALLRLFPGLDPARAAELALRRDGENPLYRIRYARDRAGTLPVRPRHRGPAAEIAERELAKQLALRWEAERLARAEGDPARLCAYAAALADRFFAACRAGALGGAEDAPCRAVRAALDDCLRCLGAE